MKTLLLALILVFAPAIACAQGTSLGQMAPATTVTNSDLLIVGQVNSASPTGYSTRQASVGQVMALAPASGPGTVAPPGINGSGTTALVQPDRSVQITLSSTTPVALVPLTAGKQIYVTGFDAAAAGATSLTFEYGTQATTPCDTGTHVIAGPYPLSVWSTLSRGGGLGVIWLLPAATQLCAVGGNSTAIGGSVSYTVM